MTKRITSSLPVRSAVACLALFGASQSMAQTVSGQLTAEAGNGSGYAAYVQNLTFSGGSSAYGGAGVLVCIDAFSEFPALPSERTYDVVGAASVVESATYANRSEALIDWVVDNYFTSFLDSTVSAYAFNQVLWEITADYDGTLASLSSSSADGGYIYGARTDYISMLDSLKSAYSSIPDSYRSSTFTTTFLVDQATDQQYQNMVLVTAVPEPSTYLMMFAGVGALMAWRRRSAKR